MPQNVSFFNPQNEAEALRRQRMATMLAEQTKAKPTEVVSGIAVPQSSLVGLANMLGGAYGNYQQEQADALRTQDAAQRQQFLQSAVQSSGGDSRKLAEALMGQPATVDAGLNLYAKALESGDINAMGEQAFMKASVYGIDSLTPQERAALSFIDAKQQTFGFNPATGVMEQKPSLLSRAGFGGLKTTPAPAPAPASPPMPPPASVSSPAPNNNLTPSQAQQVIDVFAPQPSTPVELTGGVAEPVIPPADNAMTPKSQQEFAKTNIEADRKRLDEILSNTASITKAKQSANTMATLLPQMGYTGFGGGMTAFLDKGLSAMGAPELIEGSPAAREAFDTQGASAWVAATEPLKGALSDKEGARFDRAVSNLTTTEEGIKLRAKLTDALATRQQQKSDFYERYFAERGDLKGADKIWQDFADANPVITEDMVSEVVGESKAPKSNPALDNIINKYGLQKAK